MAAHPGAMTSRLPSPLVGHRSTAGTSLKANPKPSATPADLAYVLPPRSPNSAIGSSARNEPWRRVLRLLFRRPYR
jgi:hypothetical protein